MLDFSARQAELGKSIGDDFRDGKVTLPILLAFARGDEAERTFWRRALEDDGSAGRATSSTRLRWSSATAPSPTPCRGPARYAAARSTRCRIFADGPSGER